MTKKPLPIDSAEALASYVSGIESENLRTINQTLVALAAELEGNQRLIHAALRRYRNLVITEPSVDEFYDLVMFVYRFTARFNECRIDTSAFAETVLSAWQERKEAPQATLRRHVMLTLIDAAIAKGLLSGIGRVNDWLDSMSGEYLPGNWLIAGPGRENHVEVPDEFKHWYISLKELDWFYKLSTRIHGFVENRSYTTLGQLLMIGKKDTGKGSNFGLTSLAELHQALKDQKLVPDSVTEEEYNRYAP